MNLVEAARIIIKDQTKGMRLPHFKKFYVIFFEGFFYPCVPTQTFNPKYQYEVDQDDIESDEWDIVDR